MLLLVQSESQFLIKMSTLEAKSHKLNKFKPRWRSLLRIHQSKKWRKYLKIICKSDYNIVEQLGHTASKISMLSLLKYLEAHAKALMKFLKAAHVPQEISVAQF